MVTGILDFTRRYYFCSIFIFFLFKVQALRPHGYIALYLSHIGLFVAWQDKEDLYLKKLGIYIINTKTLKKLIPS